MIRIFLLAIIIMPTCLFAQYIEYSPFSLFNDVPASEFQMWGTGNYGFDSKLNVFNPKYSPNESKLNLTLIGNINTRGYRYKTPIWGDAGRNVSENQMFVAPGFTFSYNFSDYLLNISYINSINFDQQLTSKYYEYHISSYRGGNWIMGSSDPEIQISNDIFQVSISKKISDNFSLSVGFASNNYNYKFYQHHNGPNGTAISDPIKLSSNLFSSFQGLASINYSDQTCLSAYLFFKNAIYKAKLGDDIVKINDLFYTQNYSKISFPGTIGYGVQITPLNKFKLSAEMLHIYVPTEEFSTKVVLGINYNPFNNLDLGLMYSPYLKYDGPIEMDFDGYMDYYKNGDKIDKPFALAFSAGYKVNRLNLQFGYQYSETNYHLRYGVYDNYVDRAQMIYLGLGYSFL